MLNHGFSIDERLHQHILGLPLPFDSERAEAAAREGRCWRPSPTGYGWQCLSIHTCRMWSNHRRRVAFSSTSLKTMKGPVTNTTSSHGRYATHPLYLKRSSLTRAMQTRCVALSSLGRVYRHTLA